MSSSPTPPAPATPATRPRLVLGLHAAPGGFPDAATALHAARTDDYDFVTCRIPPTTILGDPTTILGDPTTNTRADLTVLESKWWRTSVVGVMNPTDSISSSSASTTTDLSVSFPSALAWCLHMNLPAVVAPPLPDTSFAVTHYATSLATAIASTAGVRDLQIWIPVTLRRRHCGSSSIPTPAMAATDSSSSSSSAVHPNDDDSLSLFHLFYKMMDYHPAIHVMIVLEQLHPTLSSPATTDAESKQWLVLDVCRQLHLWIGAAPIAAVQLPCSLFLTNKGGFPALPKPYQTIFLTLLRRLGRTIKVLVAIPSNATAASNPTTPESQILQLPQLGDRLTREQRGLTGTLPFQQYLNHFRASRSELTLLLDSNVAQMELDYLDGLQQPLQPLADHLEFQTYEIFEQDPVKYAQYQTAILQVLRDFVGANNMLEQQQQPATGLATGTHTAMDVSLGLGGTSATAASPSAAIPFIILVVGAGRGPLVTCCLRAYKLLLDEMQKSNSTNNNTRSLNLQVYAVEKNPSAVLYLQSKLQRQDGEWNGAPIRVVQSDLRRLDAASLFGSSQASNLAQTKAHLVVSELLGSFGCNELSPECLDSLFTETDVCGPQTISIPSRYTSHLAPVSSIKLYQAVRMQALYPASSDYSVAQVIGTTKAFETPYVVRSYAASQTHMSSDCWSFQHPAAASNDTNRTADRVRHSHLAFPKQEAGNPPDPTYGLSWATGYGAIDEVTSSIVSNAQNDMSTNYSSAASQLSLLPWTCTGFLGSMTADLYGSNDDRSAMKTQISTAPHTFSVGMFSWFPLYFPLSQPVLVPAGATVLVDVWRKCDPTKVWYEWSMQVVRNHSIENGTTRTELIYASSIHNPGGRSSYVSM